MFWIFRIGRSKYCSAELRKQLKNHYNQGFSYHKIAETLQCSKRVTENTVTYKHQTETLGRKKKIIPIIERNIITFVKKNPITASYVIKKGFP